MSKQGQKESGKAILADVRQEMAKPRMANSARKEEVNEAAARMKWKYCIEEIMFGQPIENLEGQLNDLVSCPGDFVSTNTSSWVGISPAKWFRRFGVGANVFPQFAG